MKQIAGHKLIRDTFIYTLTDGIGKAISFILLPILSFYLSPEGLGLATNFTVFASIVNLLAGQAILNALQYFYYEQTKEQNAILVSNLIWMTIVACLCMVGIALICSNIIYDYLQLDLTFQLLTFPFALAFVLTNISLQLFRLEDRPKTFAIYQIVQIVLHCVLVVLFVIIWKQDGEGKIGNWHESVDSLGVGYTRSGGT